jgi:hypothetical protein
MSHDNHGDGAASAAGCGGRNVGVDYSERTLVVKRPENASGFQKLSWRMAWESLVRSEQSGWRSGRTVWAHGVGQSDIAHGLPGDYLTLLFHFPTGNDAYGELVSKPGLSATFAIDRAAGHFLSVRFSNRSRPGDGPAIPGELR